MMRQPVDLNILTACVRVQRFTEAIDTMEAWTRAGDHVRYVCTCTAHTLMMCIDDPLARAALDHAAMVTTDGMPLVWIQRACGYREAERVYGPAIMPALCERTADGRLRHCLLGGAPGVGEKLAAVLKERWPQLEIAAVLAPRVERGQIDTDIVEQINAARIDIVWVGLGAPKQDIWMYQHRALLRPMLLIGVGAAFDFLAGVKRQAPPWMQRSGLEWFFRLTREPRRLAGRYLIQNPRFVAAVAHQALRRGFKPCQERWRD